MPRCVAGFCDNTAASGHGMFTFPKDPGLNKKWRVNMKRVRSPREPHKLWENTEYSRLCGAHFEEDCFLVSHSLASSIGYMPGRLQLKPDAVPTIFKDQNQRVIQKSGSGRPAFEKRRRKEAIEQILKEAEETLELPVVPEPEDEQMPQPDIEVPVACSVDLITSTNDSEVNCLQPVTLMDNSENIPNTVTQTYHKKIQTPLRWASKLPVKRRTFSTQTKPIMVDKSTQYNPPEKDPLPPRPTYILQDDDLDTSFRSDRTMETDDHDDPDYNPEIEPDMSDNER